MNVDSVRMIVYQAKRQVEVNAASTTVSTQNQGRALMGGSVNPDGSFSPASRWGTDPFPFKFAQDAI